jgi:hypothetical protein
MTVFELLATPTRIDWASHNEEKRIGLFSTQARAEEKIDFIKSGKEWKMDWSSFRIVKVNVE